MSKPNEYDTYIIPPNFIEGGTFFGGLLKLRNTAEALVIVLAIGIPVFSVSALTLTAKIIILCLTALPLGIIALVGINGESLSSFIFLVLKYLCNRRVITRKRNRTSGKNVGSEKLRAVTTRPSTSIQWQNTCLWRRSKTASSTHGITVT